MLFNLRVLFYLKIAAALELNEEIVSVKELDIQKN
jgi:hypothetical protein